MGRPRPPRRRWRRVLLHRRRLGLGLRVEHAAPPLPCFAADAGDEPLALLPRWPTPPNASNHGHAADVVAGHAVAVHGSAVSVDIFVDGQPQCQSQLQPIRVCGVHVHAAHRRCEQ